MAGNMQFPRDKAGYVMMGKAESGSILKAKHVNQETGAEVPVGIKILKNMIGIEDFYYLAMQIHEAQTLEHENLLKVYCSFKNEDELWIIMFPPGFSVRSMMGPHGLPGKSVGFILKETLKALHYMHGMEKLHGNVGPHCIFLDDNSSLKLAHSSLVYEDHHHHRSDKTSLLALEIMTYYGIANDKATDILMFGLLALQLFYGYQILDSSFQEFKRLVGNIEFHGKGKLRFLSCFHAENKKIPKALGEVILACLSRDPKRRPTTDQLLQFNFFHKTFTCPNLIIKKTST